MLTVEQFTRRNELLTLTQNGEILTAEQAKELLALHRAAAADEAASKAALKATGLKFPSERDAIKLVDIVKSIHFITQLEQMYSLVKIANLTNDYNDIAEAYGYPFCTNPSTLMAHLQKHIPAAQWEDGKTKFATGQGAKYQDWQEGIANLAAVEADISAGKVHGKRSRRG